MALSVAVSTTHALVTDGTSSDNRHAVFLLPVSSKVAARTRRSTEEGGPDVVSQARVTEHRLHTLAVAVAVVGIDAHPVSPDARRPRSADVTG